MDKSLSAMPPELVEIDQRLQAFRNRRRTSIKVLIYDGQGFWLCQKRLSEGRFRWWPGTGAGFLSTGFSGCRGLRNPPGSLDPVEHCNFGVVSTRAGVRIALFFSGRKHAGENLATVLRQPTMNELHAWLVEQIDGKRVGNGLNRIRRWAKRSTTCGIAGSN
jgi:IS66 Orf2 like protein